LSEKKKEDDERREIRERKRKSRLKKKEGKNRKESWIMESLEVKTEQDRREERETELLIIWVERKLRAKNMKKMGYKWI
jgi:hypothetical protein